MCSIIPGFAPAGGTLSATSASPARVADDRSKALEDRLVLLQALSHFLIGDPCVGIKTLRAGFQLFARGFVERPIGDAGEHLRVARP